VEKQETKPKRLEILIQPSLWKN